MSRSPAAEGEGRAASTRLVAALATSDDPVLAYKARLLAGLPADSAEARDLRARIPASPRVRALLRVFEQDEKTIHHVYRKWQGAHWTLVCLALLDHPPHDDTLRPLVRRVHDWLFSKHFLEPPLTVTIAGQPDRVRHCASMDGNAIWAAVRLGLEDDRTPAAVERLIRWQWPDGGWNCDKRPAAGVSSFQESLIPARGLWAYGEAHRHQRALDAAQRVAELVLSRHLLWRRRDDALIVPTWGARPDLIQYPIQFFDVLFALQVMAELGRIDDPRCARALDLLASKRRPDGGFPLEAPNATTSATIGSRHSYADWGPAGPRRSNPLVSLAALSVLKLAEASAVTRTGVERAPVGTVGA